MKRRPTERLSLEFFRDLAHNVIIEPAPLHITAAARQVAHVRWGAREDYASMYDKRAADGSFMISEPADARDEVDFGRYAWRFGPVNAEAAFPVAAEVGLRMTEVAHDLGHVGIYGIAMGAKRVGVTRLMVASHFTDSTMQVDRLVQDIIAPTNEQLIRDGLHLQLPLPDLQAD
jgi:hypothetical protein